MGRVPVTGQAKLSTHRGVAIKSTQSLWQKCHCFIPGACGLKVCPPSHYPVAAPREGPSGVGAATLSLSHETCVTGHMISEEA